MTTCNEKVTYPKMDRNFKRRWLRALRSGKYKQTRKQLKGPKGFCCLGVACEIAKPGIDWETDTHPYASAELLSDYFASKIKLSNQVQKKLASLNDGGHHNFNKIADFIEENL